MMISKLKFERLIVLQVCIYTISWTYTGNWSFQTPSKSKRNTRKSWWYHEIGICRDKTARSEVKHGNIGERSCCSNDRCWSSTTEIDTSENYCDGNACFLLCRFYFGQHALGTQFWIYVSFNIWAWRLKLNVHIINESFRYLISLKPRYGAMLLNHCSLNSIAETNQQFSDYMISCLLTRWYLNDTELKRLLPQVWTACLHLHHMRKLMEFMLLKHRMGQQTAWDTF